MNDFDNRIEILTIEKTFFMAITPLTLRAVGTFGSEDISDSLPAVKYKYQIWRQNLEPAISKNVNGVRWLFSKFFFQCRPEFHIEILRNTKYK